MSHHDMQRGRSIEGDGDDAMSEHSAQRGPSPATSLGQRDWMDKIVDGPRVKFQTKAERLRRRSILAPGERTDSLACLQPCRTTCQSLPVVNIRSTMHEALTLLAQTADAHPLGSPLCRGLGLLHQRDRSPVSLRTGMPLMRRTQHSSRALTNTPPQWPRQMRPT